MLLAQHACASITLKLSSLSTGLEAGLCVPEFWKWCILSVILLFPSFPPHFSFHFNSWLPYLFSFRFLVHPIPSRFCYYILVLLCRLPLPSSLRSGWPAPRSLITQTWEDNMLAAGPDFPKRKKKEDDDEDGPTVLSWRANTRLKFLFTVWQWWSGITNIKTCHRTQLSKLYNMCRHAAIGK